MKKNWQNSKKYHGILSEPTRVEQSQQEAYQVQNQKYKISVIMAIYNVEKYLVEALQSIELQAMDFADIQLILVNDGSTDQSGNIASEFAKQHPSNVVFLEQDNAGQARARNYGMEFAQGEFLNFMDPDDLLTRGALSEIWNNHVKHPEHQIFTLPVRQFEAKTAPHPLNKYRRANRGYGIDAFPKTTMNSASTAFFKYDLFAEGTQFDDTLVVGEDTVMVQALMLKTGKYYSVNTAAYLYRKRFTASSTVDTAEENI